MKQKKAKSFLALMTLLAISPTAAYGMPSQNAQQQYQQQQYQQQPQYQQQQPQYQQQSQYQQQQTQQQMYDYQNQQIAQQTTQQPQQPVQQPAGTYNPNPWGPYLPPQPVNPGQDEANDIYKQNQHRGY